MATIPSYRLGELLIEAGHINEQQLLEALLYQQERRIPLGEALIVMGYLSQSKINQAMRRQKWLRRIASLLLLVSPLAPVMAKETLSSSSAELYEAGGELNNDTYEHDVAVPLTSTKFIEGERVTTSIWQGVDQTQPVYFIDNQFSDVQQQPRLNFSFSDDTRVSIAFNSSVNASWKNGLYRPVRWESEIVIDHFSDTGSRLKHYSSRNYRTNEHNRYKNSEPVMYRLTLKGYSLFESVDERAQYFALNRMRNDPGRKYEVMFSITQRF